MTDYDPLAALSDIHAKRGYLLPHHGLMAISTPHLLERYDSLYSALALTERHLSRHAHEFVWLGVLISCEESLGSHHVKRFVDAGGDAAHLGLATAISAMAKGSDLAAAIGHRSAQLLVRQTAAWMWAIGHCLFQGLQQCGSRLAPGWSEQSNHLLVNDEVLG